MPVPVLICDDSSFARKQMAKSIPENWDIDISFASNGLEGLEAIKNGKGHLVFLDLNMPVLDGYAVLKDIKEKGLNSMVIVVSGDVQPEARRRVVELGALDFIEKPVQIEKLLKLLNQYGLKVEKSISCKETHVEVSIFDCYQEIANIAMGQAANLLAKLLNVFVVLPVPKVSMLAASELSMALQITDRNDTVSAVCQGFIGAGISGEALLVFNDSKFNDLARLMDFKGELDEKSQEELLMDVAGILIGACLKGIAEQLNICFSQGQPVVLGQQHRFSNLVSFPVRWKETLAIEINYKIENHNINCELLLLFTEDSIDSLNRQINGLLN